MGDIVNLRRARKAKARNEREAAAADNRIKFGTPSHLKSLHAASRSKADTALEGHKLDRDRTFQPGDTDQTDDPS